MRWFSTFDLRISYHQVVVNPQDSDKTAFNCREEQFKTMPFELCNAGASFPRLMDMVMTGLAFKVCLVYRDDVILISSSEQHFERLLLALSKISAACLMLKPSKCFLLQRRVSFWAILFQRTKSFRIQKKRYCFGELARTTRPTRRTIVPVRCVKLCRLHKS